MNINVVVALALGVAACGSARSRPEVPDGFTDGSPIDGSTDGSPLDGSTNTTAAPWAMAGRSATHDARSPYIGPQTNALKWSVDLGTSTGGFPLIGGDGTVYQGFKAFSPDGSLKWAYAQAGHFTSSALGPDGTVYVVGTEEGGGFVLGYRLYALDTNGQLKWEKQLAQGTYTTDLTVGPDGTVYFGTDKLYAFNADGSLKWSYSPNYWLEGSPAIAVDGTVYLGTLMGLEALRPDGSRKWLYGGGGQGFSAPAIGADGTIYIGLWNDGFHAVNPDGSSKWVYSQGGAFSAPALGADGTVYFESGDRLVAYDSNGSLNWAYDLPVPGNVTSPTVGADGTIYVGGADRLVALKPDGALKWSYMTGDVVSLAAIGADGTLYFESNKKLHAIGP